jgi:hypothetical protein
VTRGIPLTALFALALVTGTTDATKAPARTDAVRVRVTPSSVAAGGSVIVTAHVSKARVMCNGTIRRGPTALKLRRKRALRRSLMWRTKIPETASKGTYTVLVACAKAGRATARLTVTLPPTEVVVVKSGFAARRSCAACGLDISYGLVLQNASADEDALEIYLTLEFSDANARVVFSRTTSVGPIPAAATYYYGEYLGPEPIRTPTRLTVASILVRSAKKSIGALPPVSNLRVIDGSGRAHVLGEFTNPYPNTMSFDSYATVVCFDAAGNVIGGGWRDVQQSVPPGGRGGIDVTIYALDASRIASAQASVQPIFD